VNCEYEDLKRYVNIIAVGGVGWSDANCYICVHSCFGGMCVCVCPLFCTSVDWLSSANASLPECCTVSSSQHFRATTIVLQHRKVLTQQHSSTSQRTWMCSSTAVWTPNLVSFWSVCHSPAITHILSTRMCLGKSCKCLLLNIKGDAVRCLQYMQCLSCIIVNIFTDTWLFSA
jgi:hypothetical protein